MKASYPVVTKGFDVACGRPGETVASQCECVNVSTNMEPIARNIVDNTLIIDN